jgi:hypothetical protein
MSCKMKNIFKINSKLLRYRVILDVANYVLKIIMFHVEADFSGPSFGSSKLGT